MLLSTGYLIRVDGRMLVFGGTSAVTTGLGSPKGKSDSQFVLEDQNLANAIGQHLAEGIEQYLTELGELTIHP